MSLLQGYVIALMTFMFDIQLIKIGILMIFRESYL